MGWEAVPCLVHPHPPLHPSWFVPSPPSTPSLLVRAIPTLHSIPPGSCHPHPPLHPSWFVPSPPSTPSLQVRAIPTLQPASSNSPEHRTSCASSYTVIHAVYHVASKACVRAVRGEGDAVAGGILVSARAGASCTPPRHPAYVARRAARACVACSTAHFTDDRKHVPHGSGITY
jgi:hypothetical protein